MFSNEVQERIDLLESGLVKTSKQEMHLTEKTEEGSADLTLHLNNACILFSDLENKKLGYFRNKKCADYIVYENRASGWILHVFELKRSVGQKEWLAMKEQFKGAIQNALAIAGVLGISIELAQVRIYSVFRNDKLNDYANTARLHSKLHETTRGNLPADCEDWDKESAKLDFLDQEWYTHSKVRLDVENGTGSLVLKGD